MDVERLLRWLKKNWDEIGGDPVIPTLFDVVIAENLACGQSGREPFIPLINPITDEEEIFAAADFACVSGEKEWPDRQSWPEDWPRPWESAK